MRIAVVATNGKAGRLIAQEAVNRGMDVTADGERTGKYILAGEEFTTNSKGESVISYADYAIAMVDEIESGNHIKERISVVSE